jgi:hypothetical protein
MGSPLYTIENRLDSQSQGIPSVRGVALTPDRDLERLGDLQCLAHHVLYLDRHDARSSIQVRVSLARVGCKDDRNVGIWLNLLSVRIGSGRHLKSVVISFFSIFHHQARCEIFMYCQTSTKPLIAPG